MYRITSYEIIADLSMLPTTQAPSASVVPYNGEGKRYFVSPPSHLQSSQRVAGSPMRIRRG